MDIGWIEDLIALEEHRTLAQAAAARHVTQPAFSRRIAAIEEWCGATLVDRSRRPLRLRPEAQSLLPDLRSAASSLNQLREDLRRSQAEGARMIIAAQHSLAISLMPWLYAQLDASLPSAMVRLRSLNRSDGLVLLLTGAADVLICHETDRHPLALGAIDVERLWLEEDWLVPVSGDRALAGRVSEAVASGTALDLPAVLYPTDSFLGRVLRDECLPILPQGLTVSARIETALTPAVARLVAGRSLACWLPKSMIEHDLKAGIVFSLEEDLGTVPLRANAVRTFGRTSSSTDRLWDCLKRTVRRDPSFGQPGELGRSPRNS
ncbi:LysR family transcriptional regulator [Ruegeria marina]|uniref:Transcriptional regulator, LysR family n=1 Tax=Ruegeria marina TaxID=639004 RepID=A0A1G7EUQ4_9RHOB|nr:LysR family transcriptional regulator [Ruegeria marina]SDE67378.1 transcriptional regulator, LysR family [Ruegeria marina]